MFGGGLGIDSSKISTSSSHTNNDNNNIQAVPNDEEKRAAEKEIQTIHANIEKIITSQGLEKENEVQIEPVGIKTVFKKGLILETSGRMMETQTGRFILVGKKSDIYVLKPKSNVFLGGKGTQEKYSLPIIMKGNTFEAWPFLKDEANPPQDNIITSHIQMIVKGFMPIFDLFGEEKGWMHYISDEIIDPKKGFSLTVKSINENKERKNTIGSNTECIKFTVTHRRKTQEDLDFEKLKTNIHEYLNAPQFWFFARYQSLTERVARLME